MTRSAFSRTRYAALLVLSILSAPGCGNGADNQGAAAEGVAVGSKNFTESVILGEVLVQLAQNEGAQTSHLSELGSTRVTWEALLGGDVDVYPEYVGTLREEIFRDRNTDSEAALAEALAESNVLMSRPLGFNNTYAIGMKPELANRLGIEKISDLRDHPELRLGFSSEFMDRGDGWPALRARYGLADANARGLDHDLAYVALDAGQLDAIDVYTTDAEIADYDLKLLEDDLNHFPRYDAVIVYRADLVDRFPQISAVLKSLEGSISEETMRRMNGRVKLDQIPEGRVANDFLSEELGVEVQIVTPSLVRRLEERTWQHLQLVGISLSAAIVLALPLGIVCARRRRVGQAILAIVGIIQTIPSLALFVFMIPLLGIGPAPVIVALFLYSLLPIVRNTHAGLSGIAPALLESADAIGLPKGARLRLVELPIAARTILAGIKTSAVINVGTATLGGLMAAGGYGATIIRGLRLNNVAMILEGAIPAALMALAVQGLFELAERRLVSKGLRLKQAA